MNNIEENHVILVDIGNTRIKYSLLCDAEEEPSACEDAISLFSFIDSQEKISHLYIASVRNQELVDEISTMCNERNIIFVEKHFMKIKLLLLLSLLFFKYKTQCVFTQKK